MNHTVKYHNDLNSVSMRKWTADEMNLFFTIIAKIKNAGVREITLDTEDLKGLIKFKSRHKNRWNNVLIGVSEKISELKYRYEDDRYYRIMNLFTFFEIDKEKPSLKVAVSEQFEYVLNRLELNFTYYKLDDFVDIKSTYAKTAYRLFKQWKTIGKTSFKIDDLKASFAIPESYNISAIDRAVIKPIMSELPDYFENLKVKKIKSNTRGTPVIGYEFTWNPEKTGTWIDGKYDKDSLNDWMKKNSTDNSDPVPMINWVKEVQDHNS